MTDKKSAAGCVKSTYFKIQKSLVKVLQQSPQNTPNND